MGDDLSVAEIARRLRPLAADLAPKLIPWGRRRGHEWVALKEVGGRPVERSLVIVIDGAKRGSYFHNSASRGGDLINAAMDLWSLSRADAVAWAKEVLGLGPGLDPETKARAQEHARRAQAAAEARAAEVAESVREKRERARAYWRAAQPIAGTLGEVYFRARAIGGELPPTLRFAPALPYGHPCNPAAPRFPAVVAAVQAPDGSFSGVWRIYLAADGRGKAPVEKPKLGLGVARGGAVRLGPAAPRLATCEGIETGLSIQEDAGLPTWAGLSAVGVQNLVLPRLVREPVIVPDPDLAHLNEKTGAVYWPGPDAAAKAAQRYREEGRRPVVVELPLGLDANDLKMRSGGL
ncbi:DUF7146 domain-containing protein [Brevundimonas sp.]|uniref:DUF7146 domain-containing protein n=1 Tax=Brevundimonas sp. TaxID=1871086 RepID=UPI002D531F22|nr:toprim domain-containing protein [Brevundimonas sp.]HYD29207.1 toprim domain-containing protein [Brevundimonas sp.]